MDLCFTEGRVSKTLLTFSLSPLVILPFKILILLHRKIVVKKKTKGRKKRKGTGTARRKGSSLFRRKTVKNIIFKENSLTIIRRLVYKRLPQKYIFHGLFLPKLTIGFSKIEHRYLCIICL